MTWTEIGWVIIGLSSLMLLVFYFLFQKRWCYRVRSQPAVQTFLEHRVRAVEGGEAQQVLLGTQLWSRAYPALGLHALSVFSSLVKAENSADEKLTVSDGTGELALFARQIVQGQYQDGVSPRLSISLPGPTPISFVLGLLPELGLRPHGTMGLFGNFDQMGAVLTEAAMLKRVQAFAAAGSITAQAALFLNLRNLLIGEEVFMLPGLIDPTPGNQAGWATEDVLRVLLMILMVIVAGLKLAGLL